MLCEWNIQSKIKPTATLTLKMFIKGCYCTHTHNISFTQEIVYILKILHWQKKNKKIKKNSGTEYLSLKELTPEGSSKLISRDIICVWYI